MEASSRLATPRAWRREYNLRRLVSDDGILTSSPRSLGRAGRCSARSSGSCGGHRAARGLRGATPRAPPGRSSSRGRSAAGAPSGGDECATRPAWRFGGNRPTLGPGRRSSSRGAKCQLRVRQIRVDWTVRRHRFPTAPTPDRPICPRPTCPLPALPLSPSSRSIASRLPTRWHSCWEYPPDAAL